MDIRFTLAAVAHREIVYEIDPRGKVHVLLVSDDKRDLRSWMEVQKRVYRDHWTVMHDPSGEAHLSAVHYWMGRFMERAVCREVWVDGLCVLQPVPPFLDSS